MSAPAAVATLAPALRAAWQDTLGRPPAGDDTDFFAAGGDSLLLVRMVAQLRRSGIGAAPLDVLAGRTFAGILARLTPALVATADGPGGAGAVPLLPTQARWLSSGFAEPDRFNLGWVFRVPADPAVSDADIEEALRRLVVRHEALRTRYVLDSAGGARAEVLAEPPGPLLTVVPGGPLADVLRAGNGRHRLATGAVCSAQWLPEERLLQVAVHHLTLDGYSTDVLADDLENLLLDRPLAVTPGQPRAQADAIRRWLDTEAATRDARRWRDLGWDRVRTVPTDTTGPGELPSMAVLSGELDPARSAAVRALSEATGHSLDLLVAAAAARAIGARFGLPAVSVDVYHHGRDQLPDGPDLSGSVGYFQSSFPVVFDAEASDWPAAAVADLDRVPQARFGFDALRFGGRGELAALPTSRVRLNFRGRMNEVNARQGRWLRPADVDAPGRRAPTQTEPYLLMLEGDLVGEQLVFSVKYSRDHYAESTIRSLIDDTLRLLAAIRLSRG